jgi:hypothetical protein
MKTKITLFRAVKKTATAAQAVGLLALALAFSLVMGCEPESDPNDGNNDDTKEVYL